MWGQKGANLNLLLSWRQRDEIEGSESQGESLQLCASWARASCSEACAPLHAMARRKDPADGGTYTYDEICKYYRSQQLDCTSDLDERPAD